MKQVCSNSWGHEVKRLIIVVLLILNSACSSEKAGLDKDYKLKIILFNMGNRKI